MLNDRRAKPNRYEIAIKGDLCPYSRYEFKTRLAKYDGDWLEDARATR